MIPPPKPGDRATRNGITAHVQFVCGDQVYGIRAPAGAMEQFWKEGGHTKTIDMWEEPKPWWQNFRISLTDWQIAVQDAVYERAD